MHGSAYFARLCEVLAGPAAATSCCSRTGGATATSASRASRQRAGHVRPASRSGARGRAGPGVALAPRRGPAGEQEAVHLAETVNRAGGECCSTSGRGGRLPPPEAGARPPPWHEEDDVAFAGGTDLCHGRRDDERHRGDPQAVAMDARYGDTPRGTTSSCRCGTGRRRSGAHLPRAVGRPHPARPPEPVAPLDRPGRTRAPAGPARCPRAFAVPPTAGPHAVQVLRTYPAKRPPYLLCPPGRAQHRPGLRQGLRPGPAPHRDRGPVPVVGPGGRWWPPPCAGPRPAAHRPRALLPRAGRRAVRAAGAGRAPRRWPRCGRAGGERVAVYDLENDEGSRSTSTPRRASSTTCGPRWARTI